jgi:hypothetical protein
MPRVTQQQTNFTGGEQSPRLAGRTDIDSYGNAVALMQNAHPLVHGGAVRRPGTFWKAAASTSTANRSILIPFVKGRAEAWFIEFANLTAKIFNVDGTYTGVTLTTPYSDSLLSELDWAQSDGTMWLFFPYTMPYRLQRLDGGTWALSVAPFTQLPFAEIGIYAVPGATLSLATVGVGRSLTAASAVFLASFVGRAVTFNEGIAVITGYTSTTVVTVEITRAFSTVVLSANQWVIDSSPQTTCTPSAKDPEGATITLTLGAAGWSATDVGSMVRINGGLCKITTYTDALNVNATIVRVLGSITAAPSLAWSLEPPVWGPYVGYPRTGTIFQQRLVAGGTKTKPRSIWGSRIGEQLNFELGTDDDQAFSYTIDSDESTPIAWVSANSDLLVLTESGAYSVRSGLEKALTATSVRVKPEGNSGAALVRPVTVRQETLFLQRAGRKVLSLAYSYQNDRYSASDISKRSEHLTRGGIAGMAYQEEPESIVWAWRTDGTLLSCTLDRDENVVAWARHYTQGAVESVATAPLNGRDVVAMIVRRYINGATVRTIETMDSTWEPLLPGAAPAASEFPPYTEAVVYGNTVDCGLAFDNASGQTVFAVPHLIGATVDIVADGAVQPQQVVPGSGNVTLVRASYRTLIGLPFRTKISMLTPEIGTGTGSAQGNSMRTGEVTVRLLDSVGGSIESADGTSVQALPARRLGPDVLDEPPEFRTTSVRVEMLGWDRGKSTFSVVQDQPLPLHVLAVIRKLSVND